MSRQRVEILNKRQAGDDHQVVTLKGGGQSYRKKPCSDCPWRRDAVGEFPAEAFRHSAPTAYDVPDVIKLMVEKGYEPGTFACHQAGTDKPATCAGFLLSNSAQHNLALRMSRRDIKGVTDDGLDLFDTYREMAEANGVGPEEEVLKPCR